MHLKRGLAAGDAKATFNEYDDGYQEPLRFDRNHNLLNPPGSTTSVPSGPKNGTTETRA